MVSRLWFSVLFTVNTVALFTYCLSNTTLNNKVTTRGDFKEYQSIAVNQLSGHGFMVRGGILSYEEYNFSDCEGSEGKAQFYSEFGRSFYRNPTYPAFLSLVYWLFGVNPWWVSRVCQLLILSVAASSLLLIGRKMDGLLGVMVGLVASWLFTIEYGRLALLFYPETISLMLSSLIVIVWSVLNFRQEAMKSVLLGLVLGFFALTKGYFYHTIIGFLATEQINKWNRHKKSK